MSSSEYSKISFFFPTSKQAEVMMKRHFNTSEQLIIILSVCSVGNLNRLQESVTWYHIDLVVHHHLQHPVLYSSMSFMYLATSDTMMTMALCSTWSSLNMVIHSCCSDSMSITLTFSCTLVGMIQTFLTLSRCPTLAGVVITRGHI